MLRCHGCGALFAEVDGPTHAYMLGSAGCWAGYGEVLAREYANPQLFAAVHRLTVDAYALQHPGSPDDRRARQSVWVHFASLRAVLTDGLPWSAATRAIRQQVGADFPAPPPAPSWTTTIADVAAAEIGGHTDAVENWAKHVLAGWEPLLGRSSGPA